MDELKLLDHWTCYSCSGHCSCAVCQRKRGNYVAKRKPPSPKTEKNKKQKPLQELPPSLPIYNQGQRSNSSPFLIQPTGDINDLLILSLAANERRSFSTDASPRSGSFDVSSKESFNISPRSPSNSISPRSPHACSYVPVSPSSENCMENSICNKFKISFLLDDEPSEDSSSKTSPRLEGFESSFSSLSDELSLKIVRIPFGHTHLESI